MQRPGRLHTTNMNSRGPEMHRVLIGFVCGVTLLTAACGSRNESGDAATPPAAERKFAAVDEARLLAANDPANDGQWMSYGRDYAETRFSPLKAINTETV